MKLESSELELSEDLMDRLSFVSHGVIINMIAQSGNFSFVSMIANTCQVGFFVRINGQVSLDLVLNTRMLL